jgi:hypothetical protein
MSEINLRRRYTLAVTNQFRGPLDPAWDLARTFRGTPRQILAEVADWQRVSGGCDVACRVSDPRTGEQIDVRDLRTAVTLAETGAR